MITGQVESEDYHEKVLSTLNCCWAPGLVTQNSVLQERSCDLSKANPQTLSVVYSSGCKKKHDEVNNALNVSTEKIDQIVKEKKSLHFFFRPLQLILSTAFTEMCTTKVEKHK